MKNQFLYTKELAGLFNISEHTVRYYVKESLLKPSAVSEKGYNLFGFRAIRRLEQILALRSLDVSLPRIKTYLAHQSPEQYFSSLKETRTLVEAGIDNLTAILKGIDDNLIKVAEYAEHSTEPFVKELPDRYLFRVMKLTSPCAFSIPLDLFYAKVLENDLPNLLKYSRNLTIYTEAGQTGAGILIHPEDLEGLDRNRLLELPAGRYLNLFSRTASADDYEHRTKQINQYIEAHKIIMSSVSADLYASDYYIYQDGDESSLLQIKISD